MLLIEAILDFKDTMLQVMTKKIVLGIFADS